MDLNWEEGFQIDVRIENGTAVIRANREGLLSLANHLKALAGEPAPNAPLPRVSFSKASSDR